MTFTIEHLTPETITGKEQTFVIPNSPEGFSEINPQKEKLYGEQKQIRAFQIVTSEDGTYEYLVEANDGDSSFTTEAGDYAVFTAPWSALSDIDQFIGGSYGEVMQSSEYTLSGYNNIQLINRDTKQVTVKIPVAKK